jgi:hypothetical protein
MSPRLRWRVGFGCEMGRVEAEKWTGNGVAGRDGMRWAVELDLGSVGEFGGGRGSVGEDGRGSKGDIAGPLDGAAVEAGWGWVGCTVVSGSRPDLASGDGDTPTSAASGRRIWGCVDGDAPGEASVVAAAAAGASPGRAIAAASPHGKG